MNILRNIILLCLFANSANAAVYYVDSVNGVDFSSGRSPDLPWKTLKKVSQSTFNPGDAILLKRGDVWHETLEIPSSGASGSPVIFGVYGTGGEAIVYGEEDYSLSVQAKSYIKIERICFTGKSVYADQSSSVTFNYCVVKNSIDRGFNIHRSSNVAINNCTISANKAEGIYAGSNTTVTIVNSMILGNGGAAWYGLMAENGATINYSYCLITGNGFSPRKNIANRSGLVNCGYNLIEKLPRIRSFAANDYYFVISIDDYDIDYWSSLAAALQPYGVKITMFLNGAYVPEGKKNEVRNLVKAGNEIAVHNWSHTSLVSHRLFTITTTNKSPSVSIDMFGSKIVLTSSDNANNVAVSWNSAPKSIQDLIDAVRGKGWTIRLARAVNIKARLSSLADSHGQKTTFPYAALADVSPPDYPFWRDEILTFQTWIENEFGVKPTTMAYPYGAYSKDLAEYIKNVAGLKGARTTCHTTNSLASLNMFGLPGMEFTFLKGNGSENAIRANARHAFVYASQTGCVYFIFSHKANEASPQQMAWLVDEIVKAGGKFCTFREAVDRIRTDHSTGDGGYTYTKSYADHSDFHLFMSSPCIDAGAWVNAQFDYEGNPVPKGNISDIGAFEYHVKTNNKTIANYSNPNYTFSLDRFFLGPR